MRAVTFDGTANVKSHNSAIFPPPSPVKAKVCIPILRADSTAFTTFLLFPDVDIPIKISPERPNPSTWRANTSS